MHIFFTDQREENYWFFINDDVLLQSTEYSIFVFKRYNIQKEIQERMKI